MWDYLKGRGCEQCGETNVILLEFNHRDSHTKAHNISRMVSRGYSVDAIRSEIAKCEILCTTCHRFHTAKQQQWYSSFIDYNDPESVFYWYKPHRETGESGWRKIFLSFLRQGLRLRW